MAEDVTRLIEFYKSPLGRISRALVRDPIIEMAGSVRGKRVLGLGFATPYLRFALRDAERVIALMPARQGASAWPREGPSLTALCDPLELRPLPLAGVPDWHPGNRREAFFGEAACFRPVRAGRCYPAVIES